MLRSSLERSKPPCERHDIIAYSNLLCESYERLTHTKLLEHGEEYSPKRLAEALYNAPFPIVSHGTQDDPLFRYANLAAQQLWGIGWDGFVHMPSRLTVEPVGVEERQRLLDEATRKGFVDHYEGVRITADKKRFRIKDTLLWNVVDEEGRKHGQAAAIKNWEWL